MLERVRARSCAFRKGLDIPHALVRTYPSSFPKDAHKPLLIAVKNRGIDRTNISAGADYQEHNHQQRLKVKNCRHPTAFKELDCKRKVQSFDSAIVTIKQGKDTEQMRSDPHSHIIKPSKYL
jgi:hypothetical protein